jgi:hypothetical protein
MEKLERTLLREFDCGIGIFDPVPVGWAAEVLAQETSVEHARSEVRRVNQIREKHGLIPVTFGHGHPLFGGGE